MCFSNSSQRYHCRNIRLNLFILKQVFSANMFAMDSVERKILRLKKQLLSTKFKLNDKYLQQFKENVEISETNWQLICVSYICFHSSFSFELVYILFFFRKKTQILVRLAGLWIFIPVIQKASIIFVTHLIKNMKF